MIVLQQNLRSFTQWDFSHFRENLRNDLLKIIFRIVSPKTPKNRKFKNPVALRAVFFLFHAGTLRVNHYIFPSFINFGYYIIHQNILIEL